MCNPNISSTWLSAEMARALSAACPPLKMEDIFQAADRLTARHAKPGAVIRQLRKQGTDLMQVRRMVCGSPRGMALPQFR